MVNNRSPFDHPEDLQNNKPQSPIKSVMNSITMTALVIMAAFFLDVLPDSAREGITTIFVFLSIVYLAIGLYKESNK